MAREFYRRLFALDPVVEDLFTDGPEIMADKFSGELAAIVEAIVDFDAFSARLRDLATRHVGYGVQVRHYRLVGEALIGALADQRSPRMERGPRDRLAPRLQPRRRGDDGGGRRGRPRPAPEV